LRVLIFFVPSFVVALFAAGRVHDEPSLDGSRGVLSADAGPLR
jgi:hypothetical protein